MVHTPQRTLLTRSAIHIERPANRWRLVSRRRSIADTLRLLDDDPFLFCDCDDGVPHTCG
jgi:hypothetical protein